MQPTPQGAMLRIWNPGSDTNGPPDEVRTTGAYQATETDLTEGVRTNLEGPADASND